MSHAILMLGKCSLEVFALSSQALQMSRCQSLGSEILQAQGAWLTHSIPPGHPGLVPGYKGALTTCVGTTEGGCDSVYVVYLERALCRCWSC